MYDETKVDSLLEKRMQKAQNISSMVLALRKKEKIKVRQPLQKIMIPVLDEAEISEINLVADLIKAEVNVKEIELIDDASGVLVKQIKPNFKTLGPKFGKEMGIISQKIKEFSQEDIQNLEKNNTFEIISNQNTLEITLDDVEITSQDIPGWLVASNNGQTVALDITLTEALKQEGIARELVNRIQNIRKENNFEITDKINIILQKNSELEQAVANNFTYITTETLTENLQFVDVLNEGIEIDFDDIRTQILIKK